MEGWKSEGGAERQSKRGAQLQWRFIHKQRCEARDRQQTSREEMVRKGESEGDREKRERERLGWG